MTHFPNEVNQASQHWSVKYPCAQCDYKVSTKSRLSRHIKSKHEGIKYPCDQCNFKATRKYHLLTHFKSKHEGITYPCEN